MNLMFCSVKRWEVNQIILSLVITQKDTTFEQLPFEH